jgi:hypothetical protein
VSHYESPYMDSYFREGAAGQAYDEGISNPFELAIFDLEKEYLDQIYSTWLSTRSNVAYLDYAAGTGRILTLFRDRTDIRFAMDTCPAQLEHARSKVPEATFIVGNIVTNPTSLPATFDLITCFRLLLNLESANRLPLLRALGNALNDDGILVVDNHMNRYSILGITALVMRRFLGYKEKSLARPDEKAIISTMSEREMRNVLAMAGFHVKKIYRFMVIPGHKYFLLRPARLLLRIERVLARIPVVNFFGKNQMFVCQKVRTSDAKSNLLDLQL